MKQYIALFVILANFNTHPSIHIPSTPPTYISRKDALPVVAGAITTAFFLSKIGKKKHLIPTTTTSETSIAIHEDATLEDAAKTGICAAPLFVAAIAATKYPYAQTSMTRAATYGLIGIGLYTMYDFFLRKAYNRCSYVKKEIIAVACGVGAWTAGCWYMNY